MSYQQTTIGCPKCGERNDVGMAFCIFCGGALSSKASEVMPMAQSVLNPTGASVLGNAMPAGMTGTQNQQMSVTCLACGRSDPLNKEFCIYCGQKAATTAVNLPGSNTSGVSMQTQINALEQDIRHSTPEPPPGKHPIPILPGLLGVLGGLVVGSLLAIPAKQLLEAKIVHGQWPTSGLVIYADKQAQVFIKSADDKVFTAAATAPNGSLAIDDLQPGKYDVTITAHDGKSKHEKVSIEPGHPAVLGYPQKLHL